MECSSTESNDHAASGATKSRKSGLFCRIRRLEVCSNLQA